jgi:hypothetical protein
MHERQTIRHNRRQTNGRFAPLAQLDRGTRQPSHPQAAPAEAGCHPDPEWNEGEGPAVHSADAPHLRSETALQTIDYGTYPVGSTEIWCHPERSEGTAVGPHSQQSLPLQLPPVEDTESIQLALIDVLQALAANQLDPKRASLLLYGLQVASANAKHLNIPSHGVRTITYTSDGIALAPQDYGWDIEDIEEEANREEEDNEEEE